jgi:hypothetical protein
LCTSTRQGILYCLVLQKSFYLAISYSLHSTRTNKNRLNCPANAGPTQLRPFLYGPTASLGGTVSLVEIYIVKAFINLFRSVNNQEYLLCPAEQLNSLVYTFWLCIYVVNHILTVYILVIVFERYIWPLALASHWLADFCKYHTEITTTKLPFPSATDNNSKPINFYHWPRKANPSHLMRQSLFKRWLVYVDSLLILVFTEETGATVTHVQYHFHPNIQHLYPSGYVHMCTQEIR